MMVIDSRSDNMLNNIWFSFTIGNHTLSTPHTEYPTYTPYCIICSMEYMHDVCMYTTFCEILRENNEFVSYIKSSY